MNGRKQTIQIGAQLPQTAEAVNFIGGRPKIPPDVELPRCRLCDAIQTFFFQVAFPERHLWAGESLAVFQCTSCYDGRYLVPMTGPNFLLPGETVPDGVLETNQVNFRLLTFPTDSGVVRESYAPKVQFVPLLLNSGRSEFKTRSRIGGKPNWVNGDRGPGNYMGKPLDFLMQWEEYFNFLTLPGTPPRAHPSRLTNPLLSVSKYFDLFSGCELYFFGNLSGNRVRNIHLLTTP